MRFILLLLVACGGSSEITATCAELGGEVMQAHGPCRVRASGVTQLMGQVVAIGETCPTVDTCPSGWDRGCDLTIPRCTYYGSCKPIGSDGIATCDFVQTLNGESGLMLTTDEGVTCVFRACE
jgi:hypothetical protein